MAVDPPYRLDPFQNIINISWFTEQYTGYCPFDYIYVGFAPEISIYPQEIGGVTIWPLYGWVDGGVVDLGYTTEEGEARNGLTQIGQGMSSDPTYHDDPFFWYISGYGGGLALMIKGAPTLSSPCYGGTHVPSPP